VVTELTPNCDASLWAIRAVGRFGFIRRTAANCRQRESSISLGSCPSAPAIRALSASSRRCFSALVGRPGPGAGGCPFRGNQPRGERSFALSFRTSFPTSFPISDIYTHSLTICWPSSTYRQKSATIATAYRHAYACLWPCMGHSGRNCWGIRPGRRGGSNGPPLRRLPWTSEKFFRGGSFEPPAARRAQDPRYTFAGNGSFECSDTFRPSGSARLDIQTVSRKDLAPPRSCPANIPDHHLFPGR
jgi:hypothetical protein